MLADPAKGRATPDQRGSIISGDQRGGYQYAAANEGAGVLDIPGDLEASGQAISTTAGTEGEYTGGQAGTSGVPEIVAICHKLAGERSRRFH